HQELSAHRLLQVFDSHTQGGLGQEHHATGVGKTPALGNGDKGLELFEGHIHLKIALVIQKYQFDKYNHPGDTGQLLSSWAQSPHGMTSWILQGVCVWLVLIKWWPVTGTPWLASRMA